MAFFERQDSGRVYVIKIILPGRLVIHKVGMTHSDRATDRMMEILRSWFSAYRFVPYSELRLDMECQNAGLVEKFLHHVLEPNQFELFEKVSGGTEMFVDINEPRLIWFIKGYGRSNLNVPFDMTRKQRDKLCNLLSLDPNGK